MRDTSLDLSSAWFFLELGLSCSGLRRLPEVTAYFLFALFVIASGLSFLETASNPFIAQLGDPDSSERRLNFAQAFNPFGAISGALIGTIFIFSGVELTPQEIAAQQALHTYEAYLRSETLRVVKPYLVIGAIALIWAVLILRTKFPSIHSEHENESGDHGHLRDLFRYPHFLLAVVAQFFYVGAQAGYVGLFHFLRSGLRVTSLKRSRVIF